MGEIKKYDHDLDILGNKVKNFILSPVTTAQRDAIASVLGTADKGYAVYDTDQTSLYLWNGAEFMAFSGDDLFLDWLATDPFAGYATEEWVLNQGYLTTETDPVFTAWLAANPSAGTPGWSLTGNAGTDPATNFIGTTDNVALTIKTNSATRFSIDGSGTGTFVGNLKIGSTGITEAVSIYNSAIPIGFYDDTGNLQGQIFATTGTATRQFTLNLPGPTAQNGLGDNWVVFRFGASLNKIWFGNDGTKAFIHSYQNLNFAVATANTTSTATMVMSLAGLSIGTGVAAVASAKLDVGGTTQGALLPRLTTSQRNAIVSPAQGLLVWDTNFTSLFQYTGTLWENLKTAAGAAGWGLTGNAGTDPATNFIGTTDDVDLVFRRNNFRAGLIGITNTAFGYTAGNSLSTGFQNAFFGFEAGKANTTGYNNNFFGWKAGAACIGAHDNVFLGASAGQNNVNGAYNVFIGTQAGNLNTGSQNTFIGDSAGKSSSSSGNNTFIGFQSGSSNSGQENTFLGAAAGQANTTGVQSTFVGKDAGFSHQSGFNNTCIGQKSGYSNVTGENNVFIGAEAGHYLADGVTSANNIINSTLIGAGARVQANGQTNQIVIGNYPTIGIGSNSIMIGNPQTVNSAIAGSLMLGTTTPDSSAIFNVVSTTKGVLFPRLTTTQRDAIALPATGLQIFNITTLQPEYFNGTAWAAGGGGGTLTAWGLTGNAGTDPATNFIGTTDNQKLVFKTNNVAAAEISAAGTYGSKLTVYGATFTDAYLDTSTAGNAVLGLGSYGSYMTIGGDGKIAAGYNRFLDITGNYTGTDNIILRRGGTAGPGDIISLRSGTYPAVSRFYTNSGVDVHFALGQDAVATIEPSAISNFSATNKGILIPRLTTAQKLSIPSPANSLLVFDHDLDNFYFYSLSGWVALGTGGGGGGAGGWTIAAGKSPVVNNSLTLNGTDGTAHTFPTTNSVLARTDARQTFTGGMVIVDTTSAGSGSLNGSVLDISQTWNTTGTVYAVKVNVTDTASTASAYLFSAIVNTVTKFYVHKSGATTIVYGAGQIKLADPVSGTLTMEMLAGAGQTAPFFKINNAANVANNSYQIELGRGSTDNIAIRNTVTSTEFMRFNGTGNMGIGTITTSAKLTIVDTVNAGSGSLTGNVLALAQTWNTTGNPTAINLSVTNTASGAQSYLFQMQVDGQNVFRFYPNSNFAIGAVGPSLYSMNPTTSLPDPTATGGALRVSPNPSTSAVGYAISFSLAGVTGNAQTSGDNGFLAFRNSGFSPTSGIGTHATIKIESVINQTGGANGITAGIRIAPSLTAAADWRSIQIDNTSGYGIYQGSAGAKNLFAGQVIHTVPGALSTPAIIATGAWLTAGDTTTTKPYVLIEPASAVSTGWNILGTGLGVNAASGFNGWLISAQVNGSDKFHADYLGNVIAIGYVATGGGLRSTSANTLSIGWPVTNNHNLINLFLIDMAAGTMSQTSGTNGGVIIHPTYNQVASTAANTDLLVNRTETAIGSGAQYLIQAQVGGVSKFSVDRTGAIRYGAMTKAQRDAILTPAQGLMVFVTDNGGYLSWYNGGWQKVSSVAD